MSNAYDLREVRMQHPNARLTVRGRLELVLFVDAEGHSFRQAAQPSDAACSTAFEWVARWRAASVHERRGLACLCDRSSRPHRSPRLMPRSPRRGSSLSPTHRLGPAPDRRRARHGPLERLEGARPPRPLAARARRARAGAPLRVALPGRSAAHGHQALCALRAPRPRADGGARPHRAPTGGRGSATSSPTRSSMTTRAWPTSSCTTTSAPAPSPPSPRAPWPGSPSTGSGRAGS